MSPKCYNKRYKQHQKKQVFKTTVAVRFQSSSRSSFLLLPSSHVLSSYFFASLRLVPLTTLQPISTTRLRFAGCSHNQHTLTGR